MTKEKKQSTMLWAVAGVLVIALGVVGALTLKPFLQDWVAGRMLIGLMILHAIILLWNVLFQAWYKKRWLMDRQAQLDMALQLRDGGRPAWKKLERKLERAADRTDAYTVLLVVLEVVTALFLYAEPGIAILLIPLAYALLARLWPDTDRVEPELPAMEDQFPLQYALAGKAGAAVGETRPVKLVHISSCTASVFVHRGVVYLQLGVPLLDCLTQDEVYQVMLHEFAHTQDKQQLHRQRHFRRERPGHILFAAVDLQEGLCYGLQQIFASQEQEERADRVTREQGDSVAAAGALAKIAFFGYYDEGYLRTHPFPNYFEGERVPARWISTICQDFRQTLQEAPEKARQLLEHEIPSRVATHPVIRQRIADLGVTDYETVLPTHEDAWGTEVKKALERADDKCLRSNVEVYEQGRKVHYLEPLKTVENWKRDGEKLSYADTREVLDALYGLKQYDQVLALCDRLARAGLTDSELAHAFFVEGLSRLKIQDKGGLARLYKAMDVNRNYEDTACEAIGAYCTTMGLAEELAEYRAFADRLMQKHVQIQPVFPLSLKDNIIPSVRDDEVFRENLQVILEAGEKYLNRVFLLKKYTSPETWDYVYILDFLADTPREEYERIHNAVFLHLDQQQEQYSLTDLEESGGKGWLEKRPEFILYSKE